MKKIKNLLIALVLVFAAFAVVGCKEEPKEVTANGYGLVHKDYVGIATMTVEDGKVKSVTFEEVYLPSHWAGIASVEGVDADLYVEYAGRGGASAYAAKYVKVGDKQFTGKLVDGAVVYEATGIADLKAWVQESEANAKWYADELLAGNAKATDANGTEVTFDITADTEGGFKKSVTGYWSGTNYPLGWKGNMEALSEALVGTTMDLTDADLVKNDETGYWSFGTTTTGATLTDAKDYYAVAKRAYETATK